MKERRRGPRKQGSIKEELGRRDETEKKEEKQETDMLTVQKK